MHNVRINNVPKQCVRLLYTYKLNIEENEVGPDSRQVPFIRIHPVIKKLYVEMKTLNRSQLSFCFNANLLRKTYTIFDV